MLEAEKLDPVSPITSYVATAAYLANDRIDEAIIEGQRTLQLDPNYFYLDSNLAAAYREKGQLRRSDRALHQSPGGNASSEQRPCHHLRADGPANGGAEYSCSASASEGEAIRLGACDRRSLRRAWRQRRSFSLARTRLCRTLRNTYNGSRFFPNFVRSIPMHASLIFCGESVLRITQFWRSRRQLYQRLPIRTPRLTSLSKSE